MKNKLLFFVFLLFASLEVTAQSPTQAFPAPDLLQCGSEVFDLTVQDTIILGNQDPINYFVTYYTTQADAANGTNAIFNPEMYVAPQQQTIFAKVTNNLDGSFAITVFTVGWGSGVNFPDVPDVTACSVYILPEIDFGEYYTGPDGTGLQLPSGTAITQGQLLFIYGTSTTGCTGQTSFVITILQPLTALEPLYACNPEIDDTTVFNLHDIETQLIGDSGQYSVNYFETAADAENNVNPIVNSEIYVVNALNTTIYARVSYSSSDCIWVIPFDLIVVPCTENTISGFASLNFDDNCETFEAAGAGMPVYYVHDNTIYVTYTNEDGYYSFENVPDGNNTVYMLPSALYTATPASYTFTMPSSEDNVNFCLTGNGVVNDVSVALIPTSLARSGFAATYAVIYQNLGNVAQNGTITITYDATKTIFVSASPSVVQDGNTLTFTYSNLQPFQINALQLNFLVMLPNVSPAGTILNFTTTITPLVGDSNPANNTDTLAQVVVNSFDPNDISVREGEFITEEQVDGYLHYTIRFENTGDADAVNIRVEGMLDENLDWETFQPLGASHAYVANRSGAAIEFLFNDINLPFEGDARHGYILYKIKPKPQVTIGDAMSAQAQIYFDFNDPIATNIVTTTVQAPAGLNDNLMTGYSVFPNPAKDVLNIHLNSDSNSFGVSITDVLGKTVVNANITGNEGSINVSSLNAGVYFVNVLSGEKTQTKKLIIK